MKTQIENPPRSCPKRGNTKIESTKYISLLFWLCWVTYVVAYLGRLNYVAAMAELIVSNHLTASQAGFIAAVFFASYGTGQLISGLAGDMVQPKVMMLVGLMISVGANIIVGFAPSAVFIGIVWGINGFAQSMMWPAIVKLLSTYLSHLQGVKAIVNISTSIAVGIFVTYIMTAAVLAIAGWVFVFFVAAGIMGVMAVIWWIGITAVERHTKVFGYTPVQSVEISESNAKTHSFPRLIFISGLPIVAFAVILQGMLRDGVTTWTPALIDTWFNIGTSLAVLITAIVPLISIFGVYLSHFLNKQFLRNEVLTAGALFGIATIVFAILTAASSPFILLVTLVIGIAVMHGVNTMLISIVPLHFSNIGRSATVTGAMNSFTYIGSGLSTYAIGRMTIGLGWEVTLVSWVIIALAGMLVCLLCSKKWSKFKGVST